MAKKHSDLQELSSRDSFPAKTLLIVFIFIAGILAGYYLATYILPAEHVQQAIEDYNALKERNSSLDNQLDLSLKCLEKFNIDPESCQKIS